MTISSRLWQLGQKQIKVLDLLIFFCQWLTLDWQIFTFWKNKEYSYCPTKLVKIWKSFCTVHRTNSLHIHPPNCNPSLKFKMWSSLLLQISLSHRPVLQFNNNSKPPLLFTSSIIVTFSKLVQCLIIFFEMIFYKKIYIS
jgi:hypothetical protein